MTDVSHGFHFVRDRTAWCAIGPRFVDLQRSPVGFGETKEAASRLYTQSSEGSAGRRCRS